MESSSRVESPRGLFDDESSDDSESSSEGLESDDSNAAAIYHTMDDSFQ